jgi:RNA-directed DNA polymerase
MSKPRPRQLNFVFAESPQGDGAEGGAGVPAPKPTPVHTAKSSVRPESAPPRAIDTSRLLESVASEGNLATALGKVVGNKGAPGVDGRSVRYVFRHRATLLPRLRHALLSGAYVPGDIRRVWIPKPDGGQRGLGIPNVVDRLVQQAVLQVLEPIYEPTFHDSSHGFRPGRGARTAIAEAASYVTKGLVYTVDIDLEKFFDQVNHQRLLDRLGQRIADRRILRIVRLMLKAKVVLPNGTRVSTEEGTPQGGPLSPLLSNIVLDELDQELTRRGLSFVRYADDCNIFVRSQRAGERVMASIRKFIERRLRLRVNSKKSAVDRSHRRHFLGFRVGGTKKGKLFVQLSQRTLDRLDAKIRDLTPRTWGKPLTECLARLSSYLRGWMGYFRLVTADVLRTLKYFDGHIRRRLRAIIVCQKKRPRHLFRHLVARGLGRSSAWRTAFSRRGIWWQSRSGGMNKAYPNRWFDCRLRSLVDLWRERHFDWRPLTGISS